jgi:hypothetical protein
MNDPRLKPKPLPPDPRFLNRLEYGLQWPMILTLASWLSSNAAAPQFTRL